MNSKGRTHVLLTIGVLFTIAGGTRWLPQAFATTDRASTVNDPLKALPQAMTVDESDRVQNVCLTGDLAAAMEQDQKDIEQRISDLRQDEIDLRNRKLELAQQAEDLKQIQEQLDTRWQKMSDTANQDLHHLAQMYAAMKPDQAAGIFDQMDAGFAAGFLRLIPSDQAGLILANMDNEKAYIVSVKIAAKNSDLRSDSIAP
ncbi:MULTISPECIES: MotE family protein [Hyphomonas]|uniref:MotE family protein n=1 Tax=Hyphomonas TaxID=85 RepID=UPI003513F403